MENLQGRFIKGYQLEERIGIGGFGVVYRAKQTAIDREVAIKIILPDYANNPDFIRRFESEAHLIARLEHPHITPLHDFWRDPSGAYLVMRYLRGGSVRHSLRTGSYELNSISQLLDQIAAALDFAHRHEVIHRDIKPGNILLDEDGNAYLADFGISKDLARVADNNTAANAVVGSLDYISPEQARSEPVTPRTDIYSLGITIYEMITGEHPFQNASTIERLYKHINDPLPEINNLPDEMHDAINAIIQKATAKDPGQRYPDVLALAVAFSEGIGKGATHQDAKIVEQLTMREQEILSLISKGMSNAEIAAELVVTLSTVKWHITQLYKKLGVRSRVQAIVRARELNLIVTGDTTVGLPELKTSGTAILLPEPENPYKGLHAFQMTDARDFFGRDDLTEKLIEHMCDDDPYYRFLAIVGPSGSGKSSLVKAGLIPALWKGSISGSEKWFVVDMIPGAHPLDKLETALIRVAANQTGNLREQLQRDERGLLRVSDIILPGDKTELVIVVDQFEEVFTLVEDEEARQHFLDLLRIAVSDVRSRVRVVVTLRADYYDRPLHYPEFGKLIRNRMETVLPLSAKGLERAIRGPVERVGVTFEQGLVEQVVSQMNYQAGALPLLQYALTELFDRREGRLLTTKAYQQIGGAVGALANRADEIYQGLTEEGQELAHQMFMRLVTLGEGAEDTRRRATHAELLSLTNHTDLMEEIIDQFAAYRLLSLDHDPETRQPTVEVAHEAILREWNRLRQWLNDSRDDIRQERAVSRAAEEWQQHNQDKSFLLRGVRLEQAEKWRKITTLIQTPMVQGFITASLKQRDKEHQIEIERREREKAQEQRSRTLLHALVAVFAVATLLTGAFGIFALNARNAEADARQEAERSSAEFRSIALTFGAQDALSEGRPDVALALALEATNMEAPPDAAEQALFEAVSSTWIRQRLIGHEAAVNGVAYSPDGSTAVTTDHEGRAIHWIVETGEVLNTYQHPDGNALREVAFHPNGHLVAFATRDDGMLMWNLTTDEITQPVTGEGFFKEPTFSSDGSRLLVGANEVVVMLDTSSGEVVREFKGHEGTVQSTAYSPDETMIVSSGTDSTVRIWDAGTGDLLQTLQYPYDSWVERALFLSDGERVISACTGAPCQMILWDWQSGEILHIYEKDSATIYDIILTADEAFVIAGDSVGNGFIWHIYGQLVREFKGHTSTIRQFSLSPDGKRLISASDDRTAIIWDMTAPGTRAIISSQEDWIAFEPVTAPNGEVVAIGTWDGTIRILDIQTGEQLQTFDTPSSLLVTGLAFSPDSRYLASGDDRTDDREPMVYLWDWQTGELVRTFSGHFDTIQDIAFSPDGSLLASGEWGGEQVIIWDVETGEALHKLEGHNGRAAAVVFSPDGKILYSGSGDGGLRAWNTESGELLQVLAEHTDAILDLDITDDGSKLVAATNDRVVVLWDVTTGEQLKTLRGHTESMTTIMFSPDERYILSAADDDTLILWDIETGKPAQRLVGHTSTLPTIVWGAFSPDGQSIVSASPFEIILWDVDPLLEAYDSWVVANRYIPDFTCEQRELYTIEPLCNPES